MNRIADWIIGDVLIILWLFAVTIHHIIGKPIEIKTEFKIQVEIDGKDVYITIPINLSE